MIKFIVMIALLLSMTAKADNELWFQSVMYVHHYDQSAWDWVEGFDNQAFGLEYRLGSHGVGVETFINSFGDRTNGVHYSWLKYYDSGFFVSAGAGINNGYKPYYYEGGNDRKNKAYIGSGYSVSASFGGGFQYKNLEVAINTIGLQAVAIKFSMKVF